MLKKIFRKIYGSRPFNSADYWELRYAAGGNSGDGSYGRLSEFKAAFVQYFLDEHSILSVVELGCGDGHQLAMINYPSYKGFDISPSIVEKCRKKFNKDLSKKFMVYKPAEFVPDIQWQSDLAISMDVVFHLVEEENYRKYLNDLFSLASKYVIIYSTNYSEYETEHILHRRFTDDVATKFPAWKLIGYQENPFRGNGKQESMADFYVYGRNIEHFSDGHGAHYNE